MRSVSGRTFLAATGFLAAAFLLSFCTKDPFRDAESRLVVEGWIEQGKAPVVQVSRSVKAMDGTRSLETLEGNILKAARVTVSDGERTVTLNCMRDSRYFPPYCYSGNIFGESGKTYTIEVSVAGTDLHTKASATIPAAAPIDSLKARELPGNEGYVVDCFFRPAPGVSYYKTFSMVSGLDGIFLSSPGGILETSSPDPAAISSARGISTVSSITDRYFRKGEEVTIKLCAMGRQVYDYWHAFEQLTLYSDTPLFPVYFNAPSNLSDGALGYWAAYGTSTATLLVN